MTKIWVVNCRTKNDTVGEALTDAMYEGILACGDNVLQLNNFRDLKLISGVDADKAQVFVQVCDYNRHVGIDFRYHIKRFCNDRNLHRVILDTGFVKNNRTSGSLQDRYVAVGCDGIKRKANYFNKYSPSDRWEKLNIKLQPWRTDGDHILVLGQHSIGVSVQDINVEMWYETIFRQLSNYTKRPVLFRPHPNEHNLSLIDKLCKKYNLTLKMSHQNIQDDLFGAWCCVALTTNAAVDAIIGGIPVITTNPSNMVYDIAEHRPENIDNPLMRWRLNWAFNLAYAQWSVKEISQGLAWNHIRKNLIASYMLPQ